MILFLIVSDKSKSKQIVMVAPNDVSRLVWTLARLALCELSPRPVKISKKGHIIRVKPKISYQPWNG